MWIRPETTKDGSAIRAVNRAAFGREAEGELVDALRAAGAVICSLVADEEGEIVGHVLFSPAVLEDGEVYTAVAGLGPVAVLPEHQGRGIGSALIDAGLTICRERGYAIAVVLGHQAYYPRFGFCPAWPLDIRWEHGAEGAFMVMELRPGGLAGARGIIRYRPEFDGV